MISVADRIGAAISFFIGVAISTVVFGFDAGAGANICLGFAAACVLLR